MENKYEIIVNKIKQDYEACKFPNNEYKFFEVRKTKNKFRTGILYYEGEKYFFKILEKEEYNDESNIRKLVCPNFTTVDKYISLELDKDIISLYKYIDANEINAYNTLRSKKISFQEKEEKLNKFFTHLIHIQKKYMKKGIMRNDRKSDRWFYERICEGNRITMYYGENHKELTKDIHLLTPQYSNNYETFFKEIYSYLKEEHETIFTYSHGDFHDFNFTLDGLYWDIDTFDYNPILNDFIIYYWHFYAREDGIIYDHSPWLVPLLNNELNKKELIMVRNLKQNQIKKWFQEIKSYFKKYHLENNLRKEMIFKLFCRIFLIDNVLEYSEKERMKIYTYFNHILESQNIEDELFKDIEFGIKEKA